LNIEKKPLGIMKMAWIISVFLSLVARIPSLNLISYQWRPLQTEMTAYWFSNEGIDIFNYQTPIYGPPWQIPFEFPLFQATGALIARSGLVNVEFACKLVALISFYLSALFLYLVCNQIFIDKKVTFVIIALYLLLPYNIYYSTEPLIDYLALALAFAYLFFILQWLRTRPSVWNAFMATIFGSLGVLVKPTTTPVVIVPILIFVIIDITQIYKINFTRPVNRKSLLNHIWDERGYWLTLVLMAVIPVLIGDLWTRHSDKIKSSSIFTQWLTSKALQNWNFGTWGLRANWDIWINYGSAAERFFLPFGLIVFALLGILTATGIIKTPEEKTETKIFIITIFASVLLVLIIFLNLYRHQYYYIALSASMAILAGYGIVWLWEHRQKTRSIFTLILAIWAILFIIGNFEDYETLRNMTISDSQKMEQLTTWGRKVQQYIAPDQWAVVVEYDWDPTYVYPLERKTMVVTPREIDKPLCTLLADKRFTLVVVGDLAYENNQEFLKYTFRCFSSEDEVMPGVYKVTH
jgi:4-amino-4-deoxy-L-arabinose transferase-like glycosyltransferase